MTIKFNQEAEDERIKKRTNKMPTYAWLATDSLVEAVHHAKAMGWKEKKVQVRAEQIGPNIWMYHIEPYEQDCACPSLLKYSDYFD